MNDKLTKYAELAKIEIAKWGLDKLGWTFRYNNRKRALGVCRYAQKSIEMSSEFVNLNSHTEIMDTIFHEIAHALCGPNGKSHGNEWKSWAIKCGARPKALAKNIKMNYAYQWTCDKCGNLDGGYHRKPNRTFATHRGCGGKLTLIDTRFQAMPPAKAQPVAAKAMPKEPQVQDQPVRTVIYGLCGFIYQIDQMPSKTIIVTIDGKKTQAFKALLSIAIKEGLTFDFERINTRQLGKKLLDHLTK